MGGLSLFLAQCAVALFVFVAGIMAFAYAISFVESQTITAVVVEEIQPPQGVWM